MKVASEKDKIEVSTDSKECFHLIKIKLILAHDMVLMLVIENRYNYYLASK